jgi:hypothetical protein
MGEGEGVEPLLGLYKEGWGCLFQHNIEFLSLSFSDLERTPLVWSLHLVGGFTIIRTPSRCRNRDPDQSSFRCSSGSEPGGTSVAPYVCNPARHYTCGATSSSEVLQHDREVVGSESTPTTFEERFPLSVFKGMNTDSFRYIHQHSIDLGFGTRR